MLAYVNDILSPHGFEEIVKDDVESRIDYRNDGLSCEHLEAFFRRSRMEEVECRD